jgi:nicotinamidase-related amidase
MNSALIILDMVNLFDFEGGKALAAQAKKIALRIDALRQIYTKRAQPVIFVNDNFLDWNREFSELVAICGHSGCLGRSIVEVLRPQPSDYYVLKPKHSAFLCTVLPAILSDLKINHLVLTGIATDSCILMTAQDAHMRQYDVIVPSDCVAAQTAARSAAALKLMRNSMNLDTSPTTALIKRLGPGKSR